MVKEEKSWLRKFQSSGEEAKVAVRGVRRDSIERFKKQKKAGEIPKTVFLTLRMIFKKLTDRYIKLIDTIVKEKRR